MPAPALLSGWDTSNVNSLIPDAGHILSGWAANEKPTSTNFNYMFNNIFAWINYSSVVSTANFSSSATWTWTHNLNRQHVTIVLDASGGVGNQIQPDNILYGLTQDVITFVVAQAGSVVAR